MQNYSGSFAGKVVCGFWVESSNYWSNENCWVSIETEEQIECKCNHLTNFAALFVSLLISIS